MVNFKAITLLVAVAATTSSCDLKELCFDHADHAMRYDVNICPTWNLVWEIPYEGNTDWLSDWNESMGHDYASLNPVMPDGLRVVSYRDGVNPEQVNIAPEGGIVGLPPGDQSILFYNNDFEFITIDNANSYAQAMARTRSRSRLSYPRDGKEETVAPPDMLFGSWIDNYSNEASVASGLIDVVMHPLTFTYVIRYEFKHGIEYAAIARGALSGMAKGVYLHNGTNSEAPVTLLFDCTVKDWGIEAVVKSFGLPGFPNTEYRRTGADFMLNLEVMLKNGKTLSFDVNVSDQMVVQPHGGVIFAGPFEISDKDGESNGSGFSISVNGWGEEKDVDIEF